ncbi:peptide MFS transporter [Methylosinus sp. PW1]|uniref:peptide MFS transporter n=1 Tax=Methylosinus sp. PW1 TaxID=107636 RepID=UPI00055C5ECA|nr:peptide MFS transporter [Methylosinus sp. PW1]
MSARSADLLGHPKGLAFLFATEMWERFSYYGMRALLVLYMVDHLLAPERAQRVIGLGALKQGLEFLLGPLAPQPFASQIYGLYTGFVYLTPILGGWLADRWLGRRYTVILGAALMMAGHFMMASEGLFLLALVTLALGNGAFKPNIVTQVGGLYRRDDPRRDRAFSIFYVGINLGAFLAPLVSGTLGESWGWHYGFASAGIGMGIGLAIYLSGLPSLPLEAARAPVDATATHGDGRALLGLLLLAPPAILFWAAYEQQGNTIALWAERFTDRHVDLLFWRGEIPVTWFQSVNPLMIFLFTPPLVALWARLAAAGREPSTIVKLSLGCFCLGLSYLILGLAAETRGEGLSSWLWLAAYFALLTLGELCFSPITLSLVSRLAPPRSRSMAMGAWFLTMFAGNFLGGWLGGFWSSLSGAGFFALIAGAALAAGAMIELARRFRFDLIPD